MVVGQHGGSATARGRRSSRLGDAQVVRRRDLEVLARRLDDAHRPARAPRPARRRRSPRASTSSAGASARSSASRRKACGVCTAHRRERSSVRDDLPSPPASLIVSVTGAAAIAASASASSAAQRARGRAPASPAGARRRGRARRRRRPRRGERRAHRVRALPRRRPRRSSRRALRRRAAARRRCARSPATARRASTLHSSIGRPAQHDERLGPVGPKAFATSGGHERARPPSARCRVRPRRCSALRGVGEQVVEVLPRPRPRPSRARTSARRRGSSWRG